MRYSSPIVGREAFSDLSGYVFPIEPYTVLNIGWLAANMPFPAAPSDHVVLAKLLAYCRYPVMLHRSFGQPCPLCHQYPTFIHDGPHIIDCGDGEIRVFGTMNRIYAAPVMIAHFMRDHNYAPPAQFLEAVVNGLSPHTPLYQERILALEHQHLTTLRALIRTEEMDG